MVETNKVPATEPAGIGAKLRRNIVPPLIS